MDLRKLAVEYARERTVEGAEIEDVARALATTPASLRKWMEHTESEFRPVEVVGALAPWVGGGSRSVLSLVTPMGLRLEGLDVATAAQLLQLLG
jgi:hypothetical protein